MPISIFPVTSNFAAEIGDVDLSRPLSPDDQDAIKAAFWKYSVLVFPAQQLTSSQHVEFAQVFGPLEPNINSYQDEIKRERIDNRISDVSNLDHENEILKADSRKRLSEPRESPLAHRQHLPPRAGTRVAAVCAQRGADRRPYRVRGHACSLGCVARRDSPAHRRQGRRALDLPFARQARVHRLLGPGARRTAARKAGPRADDSGDRQACAVHRLACGACDRPARRANRPDCSSS